MSRSEGEFLGQHHGQGLTARGCDPDEDRLQFAGFASQLVEKNGLCQLRGARTGSTVVPPPRYLVPGKAGCVI